MQELCVGQESTAANDVHLQLRASKLQLIGTYCAQHVYAAIKTQTGSVGHQR